MIHSADQSRRLINRVKIYCPEMLAEENKTGYRELGYLLLGYAIIAPTSIYGVARALGTFASGESMSPTASSVLILLDMIGFSILIYSQVRYLYGTGRLSWLDRGVVGISLKRIFGAFSILILVFMYIESVLILFDFYEDISVPESSPVFSIFSAFFMISSGIIYFNILFTLFGPIYILLFYFFVVREQKSEYKQYYTEEDSGSTTEIYFSGDTEGPQATVNLNESQEEATVRVRHPAGAYLLEVHVADEVRGTIENPRQDDSVTVAKKPDENLEVKTQDGGYREPTRD